MSPKLWSPICLRSFGFGLLKGFKIAGLKVEKQRWIYLCLSTTTFAFRSYAFVKSFIIENILHCNTVAGSPCPESWLVKEVGFQVQGSQIVKEAEEQEREIGERQKKRTRKIADKPKPVYRNTAILVPTWNSISMKYICTSDRAAPTVRRFKL